MTDLERAATALRRHFELETRARWANAGWIQAANDLLDAVIAAAADQGDTYRLEYLDGEGGRREFDGFGYDMIALSVEQLSQIAELLIAAGAVEVSLVRRVYPRTVRTWKADQ